MNTSLSSYHDSDTRNGCKRARAQQKTFHNESYGPAAEEVTDSVDYVKLKKLCLEKLPEFQKSAEEIKCIEQSTIGDHNNYLYTIYRSNRLTASHFGDICKRRRNTPCHNHVKKVLYLNNIMTKDMMYGQRNESVARVLFIKKYNKKVRKVGLFIDEEYGFLGATPDGIVENENATVEIKCFPSLARNYQTIERAATEKKQFPIVINDGVLTMNRKHSYYYQMQGQLRVTKREKCYFVGFIAKNRPLTVIEVQRDDEFIRDILIPKLVIFFYNCILPEIILRRASKGAQCIDLSPP